MIPFRRAAFVGGIALLALLAVASAATAGLVLARRGEVLPGVSVAGVDVGGLNPSDAREALREVVAARNSQPVDLRLRDRTYTAPPGEVGFSVDVPRTLRRALAAGRDGSWLRSSWHHLDATWHQIDLELVTRLERSRLEAWVDRLADRLDRPATVGSIDADPETLEVTVTPPRDGITIQREETVEAVVAALEEPGTETLDLPVDFTPTPVTRREVEAVADQARRALAAPLTLRAVGETTVLEPAEIAPLLSLQPQGEGEDTTVELRVTPEAVERELTEEAARFEVAPTEARFDVPRKPPVTFDDQESTTWEPVPTDVSVVPGSTGTRFDPAMAADQLTRLFRQGTREAALRVEIVEPELTTEEARGYGINHLLATFTTYHECCQDRVANIQRLADLVDGAVVAPGDQFSVNQISGVRSCDKGFVPAGTIINGELVDTCGGGVSQFGTTTFNAAFFAGVPIDSYKAHSWYISRYPMGREATLNYPSPDLDVRFTNDTGHGILVRTSYTSTSVTVSIYGRSDVREVQAELGEPYAPTDYSTEVREDDSLPPGSSRVIQAGANGFSVKVRRIVIHTSGERDTRTFTTVYTPRRRIVLRNT